MIFSLIVASRNFCWKGGFTIGRWLILNQCCGTAFRNSPLNSLRIAAIRARFREGRTTIGGRNSGVSMRMLTNTLTSKPRVLRNKCNQLTSMLITCGIKFNRICIAWNSYGLSGIGVFWLGPRAAIHTTLRRKGSSFEICERFRRWVRGV
jgi:hypothetical protein